MFTLVCGDSVQCGQEWRLPSRQTVILNLLTLTGHQDPLLWSRPPCAHIVRCHQPLSRPLEIWELIVTRASHWSPVSHFWLLIGSLSPTRDMSRLLSLENVMSPRVLATFYICLAAVKITETLMLIIFGKVFRRLFLGKLPRGDYHRTVWSPGGKNRRIFVVCGIQRFDDNSDLILRPQSRISWIISPQCIIIIGELCLSQPGVTASSRGLRIIAARTQTWVPVIQRSLWHGYTSFPSRIGF